nr:DUF3800 domain-containing protein [Candidatus Sigynarchaeota archaeon]
MSVRHVFIDESGDWGLNVRNSSHFVIAALMLPHPNLLDKILKHMRKRGFRAELKSVNEVKASHSSEKVKKHMISKLNELPGIDIVFLGLDKGEFLSKNPGSSNWAFYRYAMEKIAGCFDPGHQYYITLDKTLTTRQFNVIKEIFLSRFTSKNLLQITQSYSFNWSGLQFADLLAWLFFRYMENGDRSYLDEVKIKYIQIP